MKKQKYSPLSLVGYATNLTKISSEMEVVPLSTVYTAYIASTALIVYSIYTAYNVFTFYTAHTVSTAYIGSTDPTV